MVHDPDPIRNRYNTVSVESISGAIDTAHRDALEIQRYQEEEDDDDYDELSENHQEEEESKPRSIAGSYHQLRRFYVTMIQLLTLLLYMHGDYESKPLDYRLFLPPATRTW